MIENLATTNIDGLLRQLDEAVGSPVIGFRFSLRFGEYDELKTLFRRKGRYYLFDDDEHWEFSRAKALSRKFLEEEYGEYEIAIEDQIA